MTKKIAVLFAAIALVSVFPVRSVAADELSLSSLSAVVIEAESGEVLYAKDPHTARPMASTTKLMTALIAADALPLNTEITVTGSAVAVEGSALGLRAGDKVSLSDLLTGLLLESGNDAANMTAEAVAGNLPAFALRMNKKAAELGMKDSFFVTPSGLDAPGHAASAYDMALLGREVLRHPFLKEVCATKSTTVWFGNPKREIYVRNHNRLLTLSNDCIGMKTGFTKKSGRCLVSAAEREGVTIVVATLNGGDYWNDHKKLYEYAFSQLERVALSAPSLDFLPAAGGTVKDITITAEAPPAVTLRKGKADEIQTKIELPRFVWAPVEVGETVGQITYSLGDRVLAHTPIVAENSVEMRPIFTDFERFFRNFQEISLAFFE